jgi:hypothetical protein
MKAFVSAFDSRWWSGVWQKELGIFIVSRHCRFVLLSAKEDDKEDMF